MEEYTKLAKRIITYTTQGVLVLHVLVLVVDRLPLKCIAAGAAAHLCYLGQLRKYPFMQLWSPVTAGSIGQFKSVGLTCKARKAVVQKTDDSHCSC